jgi:glutathione transport system permease protein
MARYALLKLLYAIPTLLSVLILVFVLTRVIPGDPAQLILGDQATPEAIANLRDQLGLNQPIWLQFLHFLVGVLHGDFGTSIVSGQSVVSLAANVLPSTLELTIASLVVGIVFGVPFGAWSAMHRNGIPDIVVRIGSLIGLSLPAFVFGIMLLIVFSVQLGWFPVISPSGNVSLFARLQALVLPAITLGILMAAYITRVTRSSMLQVLGEDFIRTARAKGVPWWQVVRRHALRNAIIPVVTVVGLYLGVLIGNSVLTEMVFNRPGLGKLIVGALAQRDYPVLQGLMVLYTILIIIANLLTDLAYGVFNPRVRFA